MKFSFENNVKIEQEKQKTIDLVNNSSMTSLIQNDNVAASSEDFSLILQGLKKLIPNSDIKTEYQERLKEINAEYEKVKESQIECGIVGKPGFKYEYTICFIKLRSLAE